MTDGAYTSRSEVETAREAAAQRQHGYALVPLIPTARMIEIGCDNNPTQWNEGTTDGFAADVANDVYVAMVREASSVLPAPTPNTDALTAFTEACDEAGCAYDNEALLKAISDLKTSSPASPDLPTVQTIAADAIKTFCESLGAGVVAHGRVYYSGLSIEALACAVALALFSRGFARPSPVVSSQDRA